MENLKELQDILVKSGFKVTYQRIAVLDALMSLRNHPTADSIYNHIKDLYPTISLATVYKTLESFVEKGLVDIIKNGKDCTRYDAINMPHHHLYSESNNRIEDYFNPELDKIIEKYFKNNRIPGFSVKDIKLQIIGKFENEK